MTTPTLARGFVLQAYDTATETALAELDRSGIAVAEHHGDPLVPRLRFYRVTCPPRRTRKPETALPRDLSAREIQVLTLVADGLSNRQIGRRLGIHWSTVKTHMARISRVLDANSRENAVLIGLRHGLLDGGPL
jgi:DNA-binding NarL/FixJ family response regulator